MMRVLVACVIAAAVAARPGAAMASSGGHRDLPDPDFSFRSFYVTWGGTTNAEFEAFLKAARPRVVQAGFYGPMFHGYADDPASTGYPMQLPVAGQREALAVQRRVNERVHRLGAKVVGHFQMVNVIADPARTNGFLAFYERGWPEDLLGPRPTTHVADLLQRDAAGGVLTRKHYVDYVGLCPSSPYARQLLKQMLKLAVDSGIDGVMVNYNYRWSCLCPWCQADFRRHLGERFTAAELRERFGIEDLATHRFERIAAEIPGYPKEDAGALDWEAMRWGAEAYKRAFDEVFLDYGRSLKRDLIVATWNHLGFMGPGEERAFLPAALWGRGEHYFWYSGGYGPTALADHKAGDGWLNCLYIREMGGGKPFMLGKYEGIRLRSSVAEGLATGGSGMGLYMDVRDPAGFDALTRYVGFPARYPRLYRPATPYAEVALVMPRLSAMNGQARSLDAFRAIGQALIESHVLLDVVADENLVPGRLDRYRAAVVPGAVCLDESARRMLEAFAASGQPLIAVGPLGARDGRGNPAVVGGERAPAAALRVVPLPSDAPAEAVLAALRESVSNTLTSIDAPWTLRASAFEERDRIVLHLVNFARDEAKGATLRGPAAECPVAATGTVVRLRLAPGTRAGAVRLFSPDRDRAEVLRAAEQDGALEFTVPETLVYSVLEIPVRRPRGGWGAF